MTDKERSELQAAVDQLNDCMARLKDKYGSGVMIYPQPRFNDEAGYSRISVEVTTGRFTVE